jgi:hypothetical protein
MALTVMTTAAVDVRAAAVQFVMPAARSAALVCDRRYGTGQFLRRNTGVDIGHGSMMSRSDQAITGPARLFMNQVRTRYGVLGHLGLRLGTKLQILCRLVGRDLLWSSRRQSLSALARQRSRVGTAAMGIKIAIPPIPGKEIGPVSI